MAAEHRKITGKAVPPGSFVILPAGQKYPNSTSSSAVDEINSQVFKKLDDL